jgi:(1->4)-alpha-D-glucan 1-alpha-D-glucosylmutase
VDPDNRRPVDFERRKAFLRKIREKENGNLLELISALLRTREDGRIKLFLIYRALKARNAHPVVFQKGGYVPLEAAGKLKDHVIAFGRNHGERLAVSVVPRFLPLVIKEGEYPLGQGVWGDTRILLPEGIGNRWRNVITNQYLDGDSELFIGQVLTHFPVALLMKEESL